MNAAVGRCIVVLCAGLLHAAPAMPGGTVDGLFERGFRAYTFASNASEAVACYTQALALSAHHVPSLIELCEVRAVQNRDIEAQRHLLDVFGSHPDTEFAVRRLASLYRCAGGDRVIAARIERALPAVTNGFLAMMLRDKLAAIYDQQGRIAEARALQHSLAPLTNWLIAGGFDNAERTGLHTPFEPEERPVTDEPYRGTEWDVTWRPAQPLMSSGAVWLEIVRPRQWITVYLKTALVAPCATAAVLHASFSGAFRVWLNGVPVAENDRYRDDVPFMYRMPLDLAAGTNCLMVKLCAEYNSTSFHSVLTDTADWPMMLPDFAPKGVPFPPCSATDAWPEPLVSPGTARWRDAYARNPGDAYAGVMLARYYSMTSRSDDAVRLYTSLLESRGLGAADLTEFGTCHARENAPSQAVALYRAALARDPMANATRVAIAQHYLERDLVDLAQPLVEQAIAVYSNDVSARLTMIDVFNARSWDEDAYRLAQDTAERFPDSDDVQGSLAGAADNKDYEEVAEQAWKRAIACNHWYGHARSRLAALFMRQRRLDDFNAELAIQRALWPASPASHLPLLRAALGVRDLPRSRALCLDALSIFPDHAALHRYLGDIEYMEGHKERAIEAYETTLRYDPGDLWLRRYLDYLHERNMAFFDTYGWSQERVAGRIAATAGIEPASDEEIAHTLLRQTLIQMHQDGSSRRMHHVVVRVMRARGVQALSSVSMDASQVLRAVTYKGDGRVLEATHASERQIEFADVQVGDVIEYKYLVDRYGGGWMDENFYYIHAFDQAQNNVELGELAIALPTNRALLASLSHDDILRAVQPFDGNIVHRWWMTNIPPFRSEPNDPPFIDLARVVTASTVTNWEQVASWQRGMLSGVIRGDQNLGPLARTITAGATSDAQRADLVFRYITKNFRYTQMYETPIAGIKPHPIPDILANRCGDCKDLSLLAAELLKAAGIEARMALLRTANRGRIIRAVPAYDFNHAIVYIPGMEKRGMFMDPTFRLGAFDLLPRLCQDVDTLVLTGTGYEFVRTPLAPAADNHSDGLLEGVVDESGGCTGVYTLSLMRGDAADGRGLLEGMDDRARIGQFIVGRVEPGARMTSFDVLNTEPGPEPLVLKAGFATDRFARPGADGLALSLPMPLEPEKLLGGLEARSHPLRFDSTDMSVQRYRLALPEGYTAGVPEPDVRMNNANALFSYAAAVSNNVLDVEWKLIIRTRDIRAAEYPDFRDFMARAAYVTSQVITLRPAGR